VSVIALRPFRSIHAIERNVLAYRHNWIVLFSGFFEPVLYLLGIGFGIGSLVRTIPLGAGHSVSYAVFVAPALLASSAMNGAIYESTFNLYYKLRYAKTFETVIATPVGVEEVTLGEVIWAVARGSLYSIGFIVFMLALGLIQSPWAVLALPAAILIGFGFAALGSAITTLMRSWQDFDLVTLLMQPMFLFSATFFPITVYPTWLQVIVQVTPLYRAIDLIRSLTIGNVGPSVLLDVGYLVVLGTAGVLLAGARIRRKLLK
jgi:lipooligosaccharide transport system permease protein